MAAGTLASLWTKKLQRRSTSAGTNSEDSDFITDRKRKSAAVSSLPQKEEGATALEPEGISLEETGLEESLIGGRFDKKQKKSSLNGRQQSSTVPASNAYLPDAVVILDEDENDEVAALGDDLQAQQATTALPLNEDAEMVTEVTAQEPAAAPKQTHKDTTGLLQQSEPFPANTALWRPGSDADQSHAAETTVLEAQKAVQQAASTSAAAIPMQPSQQDKAAGEGPAIGRQKHEVEREYISSASSAHPEWSAAWIDNQLGIFTAKAESLTEAIQGLRPLRPLPQEPLMTLAKPEVAGFLAGCTLPIQRLLDSLHGAASTFDREALRSCILDLATRKSFAAKEGKGAERENALSNDSIKQFLWRWELRNLQSLPKPLQPEAKQLKKKLQEASQLLTVLQGACQALRDVQAGKSKVKAEKAFAKLAKTPLPSFGTQLQTLPQPTTQQKEEELLNQDKKHKEEELQKKDKQQKEEELQKQDKKQKEEELQKQDKKLKTSLAGFGSVRTIEKSRNAFASFFKKTPAAAATASPALAIGSTPHKNSPIKIQTLDDAFTPKAENTSRLSAVTEAQVAKIDQELGKQRSPEALQDFLSSLIAHWKRLPKSRHVKGLPPSWARKLSAAAKPIDIEEDDDISCETWRRKFLWFPAERNSNMTFDPQLHWPPYYGSWSKRSKVIKPRRPLAKDPALDYDVMEDEEWEPEPDGDSLSNDEADDDEMCPEDSANDGFLVADGQFSDDEGLSSVQQDGDNSCAEREDDAESVPIANSAVSFSPANEVQRQLLEAALRKARPRPLIISRLRTAADTSGHSGCRCGDASLLTALRMQAVAVNIQLKVPPAPEHEPRPNSVPAAQAGERSGAERPEELVPDLIRFLQAHPEIKAVPKMVQAFSDVHSERKLVKKWVTAKIKELADKTSTCWQVKPEALLAAGIEPCPPAAIAPARTAPESSQQHGDYQIEGDDRKPPQAGAMLNFLSKPVTTSAALLRNSSSMEAEGSKPVRLTTSGQPISSTADPRWKALVDLLVQPAASYTEDSISRLFSIISDAESPAALPAFLLQALLKTLGSSGAATILREGCARSMASIVTMLATQSLSIKSPPHKVWGEARSAPKHASLEDLYAEPSLRGILLDCISSPNVDLAKNAAILLGALVRVGRSQKLGLPLEEAELGADLTDLPAGPGLAASTFRLDIAGDSKWRDVLLTDEGNSPTLASFKLVSICYLLHDDMSADVLLLADRAYYDSLLARLLAAAGSSQHGCAKYGMAGLVYVLQWHESTGSAFSVDAPTPASVAAPVSVLQQLLQVLVGKVQNLGPSFASNETSVDKPQLIALEVARLLGAVQQNCGIPIAKNKGKTAGEVAARDSLLAALLMYRCGPPSLGQNIADKAWKALMQKGESREDAVPMESGF